MHGHLYSEVLLCVHAVNAIFLLWNLLGKKVGHCRKFTLNTDCFFFSLKTMQDNNVNITHTMNIEDKNTESILAEQEEVIRIFFLRKSRNN